MKTFKFLFFVFVVVLAMCIKIFGANTEQAIVMNKGSSHVVSYVLFAETAETVVIVNQNFVINRSDMMLSPQGFEFTASPANKSANLMQVRKSSSNLDAYTRMLMLTNAVEKETGGPLNLIWSVNSNLSVSPNQLTVFLSRPAMVLKKPLTASSSMNFAKNTGTRSMQNSSRRPW